MWYFSLLEIFSQKYWNFIKRLCICTYATKTQRNSKSPIFLRLTPLNTFRQRVNLPKYFLSAHSAHGWNWYPHFQTYQAKWTYPVASLIFLRFLTYECFVKVKKVSKFQVVYAHSAPFMTKICPKNNFFQNIFCFSQSTYFRLYARQISSKSEIFWFSDSLGHCAPQKLKIVWFWRNLACI